MDLREQTQPLRGCHHQSREVAWLCQWLSTISNARRQRGGRRLRWRVTRQSCDGVTTRAILPMFKERDKPFVLVFWSRDPDGTQHNQGDSLNSLTPGINGPTSLAAIRNADDDLARIRSTLSRHHRHLRPRLFDDFQGEPDEFYGEDPVCRHPAGPFAVWFRRARSGARTQTDAARSRRRLPDDRGRPAYAARQGPDRRRPQSPEDHRRRQRRFGPDLPARRRQGIGQARGRRAACRGLRQRHLRRFQARQISRHRGIGRHRARGQRRRCRRSQSASARSIRSAANRCAARSRSPIPACSKARACTVRSAAPIPGISWRCRGRTSNRSSSIRRRPATPTLAARSRS